MSYPSPILDKLIYEPNLLTPGKKPIGPVEQDFNHPLSKGLVVNWIFNDSAGNLVRDISGNNIHGNINNGAWTVDGERALDFNGSSTNVQLTLPPIGADGKRYTMAFRITADTASGDQRFFDQAGSDIIMGMNNGALRFYDGSWRTSDLTISTNTDHLLIFWQDSNLTDPQDPLRIYLDDQEWLGVTSDKVLGNQAARIGSHYAGTANYFNGRIKQFRLYDYPLSITEIERLRSDFHQDLKPRSIWLPAGVAAGGAVIETIGSVAWAFTAKPVNIKADAVETITAATWAFVAKTVDVFVGITETITAATWAWTAKPLNINASTMQQLTAATFNFTAQAVNIIVGTVETITAATFNFTAKTVTDVQTYIVTIGAATFNFTAKTLTFTGEIVATLFRPVLRSVLRAVTRNRTS